MHYFDGFIGPKAYFPDVRSNIYPQVCTNLILMEVIGSAPVRVTLNRKVKNISLQKVGNRSYLVGDLKITKQDELEKMYWFFALCIVRWELQGCLFEHELFSESSGGDIREFLEPFSQIAHIITYNGVVASDEVMNLLFMISLGKGSTISVELVAA